MTQLAFSFDVSRCSGCMACVVACLDEKDLEGNGSYFRNVTRLEKGVYPATDISFLSLSCMHCGDAPCIMVCPTGAIYREENGIVDVDHDLCVGCHSCALACPFGAPHFPEDEKMGKCDLCLERVANDLEPACVLVCPTRALGFGPIEKLESEKAKKASISILSSISAGPVAGIMK